MKRFPTLALVAVAILFGLLAGWLLRGQSDLDACLDAGGQWQFQGGYCLGIHVQSVIL